MIEQDKCSQQDVLRSIMSVDIYTGNLVYSGTDIFMHYRFYLKPKFV